ncbi:hypothetical protein A9995_14075 [Erythrobacter sp. QSSC1-22B]|uniref:DUF7146 domain-containing protein n=1 Tax=Erythrobacter sp. QSSC1-22B TaxID=1860125 RepID=UPI0008047E3B|nr:toprim domain-containing protein [Erythrobacter sp. QSSC1-22B]OBX17922.1 hypothetical protein A9995_14075 [Erythrobacter sp. QSSC1-22B]
MGLSVIDRARQIVRQLGGTWHGNYAMCRCPAHEDHTPSLSVKAGETAVLFHCFAGCAGAAVTAALRDNKIPVHSDAIRALPLSESNFTQLARKIWDDAQPISGTLAERYLKSRAIDPSGLNARFIAHAQIGPKRDHRFAPALITPIEDDHGIVSIQRTFLSASPVGKAEMDEPKRCLGKIGGGAIRKGGVPSDGVLNLAEGYEEACSVSQLFGINCWGACGIERYALIDIPASIRLIFIFSQHGAEADRAIEKAREHLETGGRALGVILPQLHDCDWNDLSMQKAGMV